jgi:hypothetical protein
VALEVSNKLLRLKLVQRGVTGKFPVAAVAETKNHGIVVATVMALPVHVTIRICNLYQYPLCQWCGWYLTSGYGFQTTEKVVNGGNKERNG